MSMPVRISRFLHSRREEILRMAYGSVMEARLEHSPESGSFTTLLRLSRLFHVILRCIRERNAVPMVRHMERVGRERYQRGFNLHEVNVAVLCLEVAVLKPLIRDLARSDIEEALRLFLPVMGTGKDELSRKYLSLACRTGAPSCDVPLLFEGTVGGEAVG